MRTITFVVLSLLVLGCHRVRKDPVRDPNIVDYNEMLTRNRTSLVSLTLGMDKAEVLKTMGTFKAETGDGFVPNPSKSEMITRGPDNFEILFYMTEKYPPFTRIRDSQATPVVLKNGKVIGWGWDTVNSVPK